MVRISKQSERRSLKPHRRKAPAMKTGTLKESLKKGFKEQANAVEGDLAVKVFIPKIK